MPWRGSSSFYYAGVGIAIYKQMKDNIASVLVQFMALDIKELLDINKKDDRMNIQNNLDADRSFSCKFYQFSGS